MREAVYVAERIRRKIAQTPMTGGNDPIYITSSFGVAEFDPTSDTFDTALRRADTALYPAKQAGRNRVHFAPTTTGGRAIALGHLQQARFTECVAEKGDT